MAETRLHQNAVEIEQSLDDFQRIFFGAKNPKNILTIFTYTQEESDLLRYVLRLNSTRMRATAWQSKNLPRGDRYKKLFSRLNLKFHFIIFWFYILIVGFLRLCRPCTKNAALKTLHRKSPVHFLPQKQSSPLHPDSRLHQLKAVLIVTRWSLVWKNVPAAKCFFIVMLLARKLIGLNTNSAVKLYSNLEPIAYNKCFLKLWVFPIKNLSIILLSLSWLQISSLCIIWKNENKNKNGYWKWKTHTFRDSRIIHLFKFFLSDSQFRRLQL